MILVYIIGSLICLTFFGYGCYRVGYHYGRADGLKEKYEDSNLMKGDVFKLGDLYLDALTGQILKVADEES